MMMQQTWSWKNMYAQDVNRVAKQQILSYFLVNFQNANHQCRQPTTPTMGSVWSGQDSREQGQNRRIYSFDKFHQHCSSAMHAR